MSYDPMYGGEDGTPKNRADEQQQQQQQAAPSVAVSPTLIRDIFHRYRGGVNGEGMTISTFAKFLRDAQLLGAAITYGNCYDLFDAGTTAAMMSSDPNVDPGDPEHLSLYGFEFCLKKIAFLRQRLALRATELIAKSGGRIGGGGISEENNNNNQEESTPLATSSPKAATSPQITTTTLAEEKGALSALLISLARDLHVGPRSDNDMILQKILHPSILRIFRE